MSENFDGHKDLPRPEGSNVDDNTIQQQYTMPVEQYSFQPSTFSLFMPSNVFATSGNSFNPSINNNLQLHTPLTSSLNTNIGMGVDSLLPGINFGNYVANLDPNTIAPLSHSTSATASANPFMISQDGSTNNLGGSNPQENPNTTYNNSNNCINHSHQLNYCNTSGNTTGSATITSEDSSFSNPEGWKARSGEKDDIPNPRKVVEILRELERSQQEMNALRETYVILPNAKRERNRVASRTCRLKKKALYEVNKIKVFHLDTEYRALCNIVKEVSCFILGNCSIPSFGNFYTNFYQTTKKKYLPGRMVTGSLDTLIDEVLRNFASGENIDYYLLASSNKKP